MVKVYVLAKLWARKMLGILSVRQPSYESCVWDKVFPRWPKEEELSCKINLPKCLISKDLGEMVVMGPNQMLWAEIR